MPKFKDIDSNDTQLAWQRRQGFMDSIPQNLLKQEDELPSTLAQVNASARSKLRRVYILMDQISSVRSSFVACGKGCADCCRMNISITKLEADQLGKATGRKLARVSRSVKHEVTEFAGQDCPFLFNNACSVYDDRPLSCRKHASYYTSSFTCSPDNLEMQGVPMVEFSGLDQALGMVSAERGQLIIADIRDFF